MRSFSRCGQAYGETARDQWVKEWPGQVVICTSQMFWTLEVHEAIKAGANVGDDLLSFGYSFWILKSQQIEFIFTLYNCSQFFN